jgi:putative NADH-flavin reductase
VKIAVIGGAGRTGQLLLEQGVARGHFMTAMARRAERLVAMHGIGNVVTGDARDPAAVRGAVVGQDAVISTVAGSEVARSVLVAMKSLGVRRYLGVSAYPVAATKPWLLLKFIGLFFGKGYADARVMERAVRESGLDWTLVRPPRLLDGAPTGGYRVVESDNLPSGPYSIRRSDLSRLLLDEAETGRHIGAAVSVSSR